MPVRRVVINNEVRVEVPLPGPPINIPLGGLLSVRESITNQPWIYREDIRISGFININRKFWTHWRRDLLRAQNDDVLERSCGQFGEADVWDLRRLFSMHPLIDENHEVWI
ncbi:uncharacterized protein LOC118647100 [Monomorium pharaonis]|uniref:uncharacterized protein LOC118647100 n=1 Tax=Monomorium pharaonis TaxID=307658 RepID=UPI0017467D90|nr:uncharacterized protein LOC118647100 [Monomorium pharaonis]